jgi:hypothetical protein
MRIAFIALIGIHGLIHLLGPAKAFGWADVSQLRMPISPIGGVLWMIAALLLVATAVMVAAGATHWWWIGIAAILLSQVLITQSWSDAKFGTLANLVILLPLVIAAADARPGSFRAQFARDRDRLLARPVVPPTVVVEQDLVALPPLVQAYLRRSGVVGRPHVRNVHVRFSAQMRSSATAAWMTSTADEYAFFNPPGRLFAMQASRAGIPFDVLHEYIDSAATFRVRIAGLFPMVDMSGPTITNDETVTVMNDILVFAPAAILELPFSFETTGDHTVRATFRNAGFTVAAVLTFDAAGDLVGFRSSDRSHGREGGAADWSTPITGYQVVDGIRVGTRGDANWIEPDGREWTYGRFEIVSLAYNVGK